MLAKGGSPTPVTLRSIALCEVRYNDGALKIYRQFGHDLIQTGTRRGVDIAPYLIWSRCVGIRQRSQFQHLQDAFLVSVQT